MNTDASNKKKNFYLDVIINDINVDADKELDTSSISVLLTIGTLKHVIESSRDPCTGFKEGRSITFREKPNDLQKRFRNNPIQLDIEYAALGENEEEENESGENGDSVESEDTENIFKRSPGTKIGSAKCDWPGRLLDDMVKNDFVEFSFGQTSPIIRNDVNIGQIVLAIMLRSECCEYADTVGKEIKPPCFDERNKICDFENIGEKILPDDVFFLIGQKPDRNDQRPEAKRLELQTSRYTFLRGQLVKECTVLKNQCCSMTPRKEKPKPECKCERGAHRQQEICPDSTCKKIFGASSFTNRQNYDSDESSDSSQEIRERCRNLKNRRDATNRSVELGKKKPFVEDLETPPCDQKAQNERCKICCKILAKAYKTDICGHCDLASATRKKAADDLTADDILRELDECEVNKEPANYYQDPSARCNCSADKECPFCRVKKMYQIDFANENKDPIIFRAAKSENVQFPNASDICNEMLSKYSDKPHLQRVLAWLKEKVLGKKIKNEVSVHKMSMKRKETSCDPGVQKNLETTQKCRKREQRRLGKNKIIAQSQIPLPIPQQIETPRSFAKRMKKKYRRKYCYSHGKTQMNAIERHQHCVVRDQKVPAHMGWLWNINEAEYTGWRPGAIRKPIRELMQYFLQEYPVDTLPTTQEIKAMIRPPLVEKTEELVQKPTVRIRKKDGKYTVVMHPLKDKETLRTSANPYVKAPPIVFTITKKPIAKKRREVKQTLKKMGFDKCTCKQPIQQCTCRSYMDKRKLEQATASVCKQLDTPNMKDSLVLSDTTNSDSEIDIEFTPPAGIIKPHLARKPDMYSQETQYNEKDFIIKMRRANLCRLRQEAYDKHEVPPCLGPVIPGTCLDKNRIVRDLTDKIKRGEKKVCKLKKREEKEDAYSAATKSILEEKKAEKAKNKGKNVGKSKGVGKAPPAKPAEAEKPGAAKAKPADKPPAGKAPAGKPPAAKATDSEKTASKTAKKN